MFLDPQAMFMLVLLVGVTGWVLRGLMVTWGRVRQGDKTDTKLADIEGRLRNVEAATSSLLVDVSSMREKQRFMAKLQAGTDMEPRPAARETRPESGISPLITQNIPIVRRR